MATVLGADRYLDTFEASEAIDVNPNTLCGWRSTGNPASPPYVRIGRNIRYREADLIAWLQRNTENPGGVAP